MEARADVSVAGEAVPGGRGWVTEACAAHFAVAAKAMPPVMMAVPTRAISEAVDVAWPVAAVVIAVAVEAAVAVAVAIAIGVSAAVSAVVGIAGRACNDAANHSGGDRRTGIVAVSVMRVPGDITAAWVMALAFCEPAGFANVCMLARSAPSGRMMNRSRGRGRARGG